MALFHSLMDVVLQNAVQRRGDKREDDAEDAERPTHAETVVGQGIISCLWASKCRDNVRRGCEGIGQASTLQHGRISRDNVHTVCHTTEPERVEDLKIRLAPIGSPSQPCFKVQESLTYAAQKVARLLQAAIIIRPTVAQTVMKRKPSARPQTSIILARGI